MVLIKTDVSFKIIEEALGTKVKIGPAIDIFVCHTLSIEEVKEKLADIDAYVY